MNHCVFNVQPINRFVGSKTSIRRPREIACFSYDDGHNFSLGESSLRYYYPPRLPVDLNDGFDTFQKLDDSADEHLDALLDTIIALEKDTGAKCEADLITWRGMMTKILTVPFDHMNGFEMNATRFQVREDPWDIESRINPHYSDLCVHLQGTIFVEENNSYKNEQKRLQQNQRMPPGMASQELMAYWGYKFETLSVLRQPWDAMSREEIEGRDKEIVNNNAQYCSVVRTAIGNVRMILGGEVDAVWDCKPDRDEDPINWVELKTAAEIRNDRDMYKYERKLLRFWAQSFLLGVPKIIVGFRDQQGILRRLEEIETSTLPSKVKKYGKGVWDGNVCINFAAEFLGWLKKTIHEDGMWRIRKPEKSSVIEVFKVEESGTGDILSPAFSAWRTKT